MKPAHLIVSLVLAGCGRIGFDLTSSGDSAPGDDASIGDGGGDDAIAGDDADVDASTAGGTWTIVRDLSGASPLSYPGTAAGNLLVVIGGPGPLALTDDAGNTYQNATRAQLASTGEALEVWYATNSIAGAHQIIGTNATNLVLWEVSGVETTAALDNATFLSDQPANMSPDGAAITTVRMNEFIVTGIVGASSINNLIGPSDFVKDQGILANGYAHETIKMLPVGTYQPHWDQFAAAAHCSVTAAFFTQAN